MEGSLKRILRALSLALRHELEGWRDEETGAWCPGDLERRLAELGVWRTRPSKPLAEMPHLAREDQRARVLADGYLQLRAEAGVARDDAVAEFVRESAYTWANRLLALRCMEARGIIDEVILQKAAYGGRSLVHHRFLRKRARCSGRRGRRTLRRSLRRVRHARRRASGALRPARRGGRTAAVRRRIEALRRAPQWNRGRARAGSRQRRGLLRRPTRSVGRTSTGTRKRRIASLRQYRTKKGTKIEGADIIPATQLYTEPYMVKFLVQNSLGALWMSMHPTSPLCESWEYLRSRRRPRAGRGAARGRSCPRVHLPRSCARLRPLPSRSVRPLLRDVSRGRPCAHPTRDCRLDSQSQPLRHRPRRARRSDCRRCPLDEGQGCRAGAGRPRTSTPSTITSSRRTSDFRADGTHLEVFLRQHPEDGPLRPALELVFRSLEHADELGSLLQIEEPVDRELRRIEAETASFATAGAVRNVSRIRSPVQRCRRVSRATRRGRPVHLTG